MHIIGSYAVCLLGVHRNTNNIDFLAEFIIKWIYEIKWFYSSENDNRETIFVKMSLD